MVKEQPHFLLVTCPLQGHINPVLQFAKFLIRIGASVTFVTAVSAHRHMTKNPLPDGLTLTPFTDGFDDGIRPYDSEVWLRELRWRSSNALNDLILANANEGKPFVCLVYTFMFPWAAQVAREHHLPSALLWIQTAMVFDTYYFYFNGYEDAYKNCDDPSCVVELPGLVPLNGKDIPSFLLPSSTPVGRSVIQELLEELDKESKPKVLLNSFDALELDNLNAIDKYQLIAIGPLIPSAFLDGKDPSDTSFGGDIFTSSKDDIKWLNSQPNSSVIYLSFGSLAVLSKQQLEEIAGALLDSSHKFLWVIREEQEKKEENPLMSCREELEEQGMIVPWCSQLEVLSHPAIGCFVTHCGWNSTLESLVSGVPVVTFPQWSDQATNAMLIQDVWKTGVRVVANEKGIVEGGEIKRCLDLVMGSEEMRKNAHTWKGLAIEAFKEGGSSYQNLQVFVDEFRN